MAELQLRARQRDTRIVPEWLRTVVLQLLLQFIPALIVQLLRLAPLVGCVLHLLLLLLPREPDSHQRKWRTTAWQKCSAAASTHSGPATKAPEAKERRRRPASDLQHDLADQTVA